MSILNSYFNRNNTIISDSYTNTGRNPVMELYFGTNDDSFGPYSYSRFIFNLDLSLLESKIASGEISTGCTGFSGITHTLKMTNTSSFDEELLNEKTSNGTRRATSFDLKLLRIPLSSGTTGNQQLWDEGVGYDYSDLQLTKNTYLGELTNNTFFSDKSYSDRPSNWFLRTTVSGWSLNGIYDNRNTQTINTGLNYSALTVVDSQHFEFGNEDIEFDMTDEINGILDGTITGVTGWVIAYEPAVELITGMTETYSTGFFTRHTQTFYEPYLQTTYNDLIDDDRNLFVSNKTNKLYLYVYDNGLPINLDSLPTVDIQDPDGVELSYLTGLTTCLVTKGVYEVTIPPITGYSSPCQFSDIWKDISINGQPMSNITNSFVLYPYSMVFQIGTVSKEPSIYGFDYYGIKQNEKILNTDVRKVGVVVKKAYSTMTLLQKVSVYYRVYVNEGTTEVQVQDWTQVNKTPNEYYFIFDTRDKIPNEYFIDLKVYTSGQVDTYKKQINFQIVNKK